MNKLLTSVAAFVCGLVCFAELPVREVVVSAGGNLLSVRDSVRRERKKGERVRIVLEDGVYIVTNRIDLVEDDSFTEWTARNRGKAIVVGGWSFRLGDAKAAVDADLRARLPVDVRAAVKAIRVPESVRALFPSDGLIGNGPNVSPNVSSYCGKAGVVRDRRCKMPDYPVFTVDTRFQWPARWPNDERYALDTNFVVRAPEQGVNALVRPEGERHRRWRLDGETDAILFGFLRGCMYSTERCRIRGLDAVTGALELSTTNYLPAGGMKLTLQPFSRHAAINVPEELDAPGEWYYRRKTGLLVFLPPKGATDSTLCALGTFGDHFFDVSGRQIGFSGLVFTAKHSHPALRLEGRNGFIRGCMFSGLDHIGCYVGGQSNVVERSVFRDVTSCALFLAGGRGMSNEVERAHNVATDCVFRHNNFFETSWGKGSLALCGAGNVVRHCEISDAGAMGLLVTGYGHLVEYTRIFNVAKDHNDSAAAYLSGGPAARCCTVRYNDFSGSPGNVQPLYLDDTTSGHLCYGNVLRNGGGIGVLVGGGFGNVISNNIIHSCRSGLLLDSRGMSWPAYRNRPVEPVDNAFVNNALVDLNGYGIILQMSSNYKLPQDRFTCRGNVAFVTQGAVCGHKFNPCLDEKRGVRCVVGSEAKSLDLGFVDLPGPLCDYNVCAMGLGFNWGKILHCQVDGFCDKPYDRGDFTLKPQSLLLDEMPDFKPIPFDKIGPRRQSRLNQERSLN